MVNEEIRDLLDNLATCKAHIDNDRFDRVPYWEGELQQTALELAELWANETADVAE